MVDDSAAKEIMSLYQGFLRGKLDLIFKGENGQTEKNSVFPVEAFFKEQIAARGYTDISNFS